MFKKKAEERRGKRKKKKSEMSERENEVMKRKAFLNYKIKNSNSIYKNVA